MPNSSATKFGMLAARSRATSRACSRTASCPSNGAKASEHASHRCIDERIRSWYLAVAEFHSPADAEERDEEAAKTIESVMNAFILSLLGCDSHHDRDEK